MPVDSADLVNKISHLLDNVNSTTESGLASITELLNASIKASGSVTLLTELLQAKTAQVENLQQQMTEYQTKLNVAASELNVVSMEREFLRKENIRMLGERNDSRMEAYKNQAGLAEWKAEAGLLRAQADSDRSKAAKAAEDRMHLEEKIRDLKQSLTTSSPLDLDDIREAARNQAQQEAAALLLEKDTEMQQLLDEQYEDYHNELQPLRSSLTALDEVHKALDLRHAVLTGEHQLLVAQHQRTSKLYDELSPLYKTLDVEHGQLTRECDKLQTTVSDHAKTIGHLSSAKVTLTQKAKADEEKYGAAQQRAADLEKVNEALQANVAKAKQESADVQVSIKQSMGEEIRIVREQLVQSEAALHSSRQASFEQIKSLEEKVRQLETELGELRVVKSSSAPDVGASRPNTSSPLSSLDDDESENHDDNDDDDDDHVEVVRSSSGPHTNSRKMPATPLMQARPTSAVANSGSKRSSGGNRSQRSKSRDYMGRFDPYDIDSTVENHFLSGKDQHGMPRFPAPSSSSWNSTFGLSGLVQQPNTSHSSPSKPSETLRKRSSATAGLEKKQGRLLLKPKKMKPSDMESQVELDSPERISKNTRHASSITKPALTKPSIPARSQSVRSRANANSNTPASSGKAPKSKARSEKKYQDVFDRYA